MSALFKRMGPAIWQSEGTASGSRCGGAAAAAHGLFLVCPKNSSVLKDGSCVGFLSCPRLSMTACWLSCYNRCQGQSKIQLPSSCWAVWVLWGRNAILSLLSGSSPGPTLPVEIHGEVPLANVTILLGPHIRRNTIESCDSPYVDLYCVHARLCLQWCLLVQVRLPELRRELTELRRELEKQDTLPSGLMEPIHFQKVQTCWCLSLVVCISLWAPVCQRKRRV